MSDTAVHDAHQQVTGEPLEWWEHVRVWRARRWLWFRERHPALARVLGLSRLGLLLAGLLWLFVVAVWFPNVRAGLGAYVGSLWIVICCIFAARTRTLSWGTCLRVFALAVPWSIAIGLIDTWLSDLVFLTYEESRAVGGEPDVHGSPVEAIGAWTAIAGLSEEALKLLPVALIVVLAPRRVRRFAVVDWLLLGLASGAAFMAVEGVFGRTYLGDPGLDTGLLDVCGYYDNTAQRLDCFGVDEFGIWPIGSGASYGEVATFAGHHVMTALVAVVVGLAIVAWRASGSSRFPWAVRAAAVAGPALMFWIAVVDHMGRNASVAGRDAWLTSEYTTIPWIVRLTHQVTGGGEGRTLLLVVLFVAAVVIDARRYARYGYPITGESVRDGTDGPDAAASGQIRPGDFLAGLVTQARDDARKVVGVVRDALEQGRPRLGGSPLGRGRRVPSGLGSRIVVASGQVGRVLWLDVAQGVAAHSRQPGESRGRALADGRAFWLLQRQARQLVCHLDADRHAPSRFSALRYRLMGVAALAVLLAVGLVAAPLVADVIGPELTTEDDSGFFWLAGQLPTLAQWWDGLSTGEQLAIGIAGAALLAIPFGFTGGLFAAGIGTYIADHGTGIGDLIEDPETTVQDYATNTSPGGMALDAAELLLTFLPPAAGAAVSVGAKQVTKDYIDDPAAFWAGRRARMREFRENPERGSFRWGANNPRPGDYPDHVAYSKKPTGELPEDFEPGWAAVGQGEKGMAYQEQITGMKRLPDGRVSEYVLRNPEDGRPVAFDGHFRRGDPPQEVFLDAKDGYADLAIHPDQPWALGMKDGLLDEARRQTQALPEGAVLEWKVSDPRGADAIRAILEEYDFLDIRVDYIPKG